MTRSERAPAPGGPGRTPLVSRRNVLRGIAAAAVLPSIMLATERSARAQAVGPPAGAPDSLQPRTDHIAVALGDGGVLLAGGYYNGPLADVRILRGGQWVSAAPMLTPRYQHAAVAMADGTVVVLGGIYQAALADVEMYDPASDSWTSLTPMSMPRYQHAAVALGGSILVTGGSNIGVLDAPEIYTPQAS